MSAIFGAAFLFSGAFFPDIFSFLSGKTPLLLQCNVRLRLVWWRKVPPGETRTRTQVKSIIYTHFPKLQPRKRFFRKKALIFGQPARGLTQTSALFRELIGPIGLIGLIRKPRKTWHGGKTGVHKLGRQMWIGTPVREEIASCQRCLSASEANGAWKTSLRPRFRLLPSPIG